MQNECIRAENPPVVTLKLTKHRGKVANLSWKSMYGEQYVHTLAAPFLKSQEKYQVKYQDLFNEILDSRIRRIGPESFSSSGSGDLSPLRSWSFSPGFEYILSWSYFSLCLDVEVAH
jgi:hypothetical protein